jgi:PBP1b-binding outer membrane lipoprotein LpoB
MKSRRPYSLLAFVALLLIGCAQRTPTAIQTSAAPVATLAPATPIPTLLPRDNTPQPNQGIVEGHLSMNGQPAPHHVLYLAPIIQKEGETMGVAALDAAQDPRVESDASGYFVFLTVPPGRYALGIGGPSGPVLIRRADGKEVKVEVQIGQVVDLGDVQIAPFAL